MTWQAFYPFIAIFFLKVLERPFRRRSQVGKLADRYKARTPETVPKDEVKKWRLCEDNVKFYSAESDSVLRYEVSVQACALSSDETGEGKA